MRKGVGRRYKVAEGSRFVPVPLSRLFHGSTGKMGFGEYPLEYNAKIHGPYDPARYYGKGEYTGLTRSWMQQLQ
ncbi:putative ATP synthase subunit f, mitochondrial [Portunus trituberculatus]|uniref:Putative ATP synthase subunit f, mitochondrial n=1 Tax=Portunus trituberculatus TaxID=210409 RepID=A0A5B7DLF7_PORTR|nr:putative ATP synthase subunit f, mitochondrial [Portunus trituberculatus]